MGKIVEKLILEDAFTAKFSKFISLAQNAASSVKSLNAAAGSSTRAADTMAAANTAAAEAAAACTRAADAQAAQNVQTAQTADTAAAAYTREAQAAQGAQSAADSASAAVDGMGTSAPNAAAAAYDKLKQSIDGVEAPINNNTTAQDKFNKKVEQSVTVTDKLLKSVKGLAASYIGLQGLQKLISLSDEMSSIDARLQNMTGSAEAAAEAQDKIFAAAERSRGVYSDMAELVAQLGTMAPEAFTDTDELIAFAEQLQKTMAISGASGQSASAAMIQLEQALASGVLRGDELNSVMEQTPAVAKTIADYMGISIGELRSVASEGKVTADVVKNAMLSAAGETNAAFEQMPLTWSQVWANMQNTALQMLDPVLQAVSALANNIDTLAPILIGTAAALAVFTAASWVASGGLAALTTAAVALFSTLLTNPITWVALAVGAAVAAFYKWTQSVGGLEIAWLIMVDAVLTGMDNLKIILTSGFYTLASVLDYFSLGVYSMNVAVLNYIGDMKVKALAYIEDMANGAIDIINWTIERLNKLPGVSMDAIEHLTFAADADVQNEIDKAARNEALKTAESEMWDKIEARENRIDEMKIDANIAHSRRQNEIDRKTREASGETSLETLTDTTIPTYDQMEQVSSGVSSIQKSVDMSNEDVKMLVDLASRKYVNNINLTSQTPVITINGQNTGKTKEDREAVAEAIKTVLIEQLAAGALRSTARAI